MIVFIMKTLLAVLFLFSILRLPAGADQEVTNYPHVKSGFYGKVYAKSVPNEILGTEGSTKIFRVGETEDTLVATYPWFTQELYLLDTYSGVSVVRRGPWPSGHQAKQTDLALEFWIDGMKLQRFSMLDIAKEPDNVSATVSHYTVIREVLGYKWVDPLGWTFEIQTHDGTVLIFCVETGRMSTRKSLRKMDGAQLVAPWQSVRKRDVTRSHRAALWHW